MNFLESFNTAFVAIRAHKLRSFLTTLGILIGVMTVIGVISLISGLNKVVKTTFSSIGTDVLYIQKYPWIQESGDWWKYRGRKDITMDDADAIMRLCPSVQTLATFLDRRSNIKYKKKTSRMVPVHGTTPEEQKITEHFVERGRYITDLDVERKQMVCVIGIDVIEALFPVEDPIEKEIRIEGNRFFVVGILEEKGSFFGESFDNTVVIPISVFQKVYGIRRSVDVDIMVQPKEGEKEQAIEEVRNVLRRRRGVPPGKPDDFAINSADALMQAYNKFTGAAFLVMFGIASLSLLVGGIGIMNIMLVSVTERTREIGIRKAVGARYRDILLQFLVEAVTVSGIGGALGILLGFSLAKLVSIVSNLPATVPFWSILLGFGFSSVVGIFFGLYPATKAARLDPVEALRYE
ncbi:ABC transporter permease [candidate division TA06 bacterium]|nr:ABC transporter permease [candidate division TA06 bacterium]